MEFQLMAANKAILWQRRFTVADLYHMGLSQDEIAAQLGIAQGTVSYDIAAVRKVLAEPMAETTVELRNTYRARLELLESLGWERYRTTGISAHARTILKCIELGAKMLGVLKDKVDLNVSAVPWDELAKEALQDTPDPIEAQLKQLDALL